MVRHSAFIGGFALLATALVCVGVWNAKGSSSPNVLFSPGQPLTMVKICSVPLGVGCSFRSLSSSTWRTRGDLCQLLIVLAFVSGGGVHDAASCVHPLLKEGEGDLFFYLLVVAHFVRSSAWYRKSSSSLHTPPFNPHHVAYTLCRASQALVFQTVGRPSLSS